MRSRSHNTAAKTSHKWWHNLKKNKVGGGFVAQPLSQTSKHGVGEDLCVLSLVKQ